MLEIAFTQIAGTKKYGPNYDHSPLGYYLLALNMGHHIHELLPKWALNKFATLQKSKNHEQKSINHHDTRR